MKSRSHRPAMMMEPRHDDWVDGSWTVDCICGVNFDDGEEMVDCDECGVWVHTRCSRYVKSEKSFSCDKCKSKSSVGGLRNDSEETEVAEFLLELPTKTMLGTPNLNSVSSRKPFRLWTDIPMEKRVHVQGVPGGESGFFDRSEMSSVFGSQLWKCAGYVPKQFNFRYTEFPCLVDEKVECEMNKEGGEGSAYQGSLFSLMKLVKHPLRTSGWDPVPVNVHSEAPVSSALVSPMQDKKSDVETPDLSCPGNSLGEETTSVPVVLESAKRKIEQTVMSNERNAKKLRTTEKDGDVENQVARDSKAGVKSHASPPVQLASSETKHLGISQERGSKSSSQSPREYAANLALKGHNLTHDDTSTVEEKEMELLLRPESFFKGSIVTQASSKLAESWRTAVKQEVPVDSSRSSDVSMGGTGRLAAELLGKNPLAGCSVTGGLKTEQNDGDQKTEGDRDIAQPTRTQKCELVGAVDEHSRIDSSPHSEMNLNSAKATLDYPDHSDILSEGVKLCKALMMSSKSNDSKLHPATQDPSVDDSKTDADSCGPKVDSTISEVHLGPRKKSLKYRTGPEVPDDMLKLNGDSQRHSTSHWHKVDTDQMKSISTSGSLLSSSSDDHMAPDGKSLSSHSRQKESSECSFGSRKNNPLVDMFEHCTNYGRPKKITKESSGACFSSKMKDSTDKVSRISNSRGTQSDSKEFRFSSSVVSEMRNVARIRVSDDGGSRSISLQDKVSGSVVPSKGEKIRQSTSHTLSKGNTTSAPASSKVPAALSDEELALLLHQELNSSPRVPRVSRMRHAGSLPQVTSASATSILMRRSSGGGKDQLVSYRKRSRDLSRDGSHDYLRANLEVKKMERKPSSSDNTRQDSASRIDQQSHKEADSGSIKHVQSMKKAYVSSLSSHTYGNEPSYSRRSTRNAVEDGRQLVTYQGHLTLPGLIADIMSEGKRMTYEELCNAVLPHWPHLRKHNGERYAYSSHSQAVLDCLRNRSEWSRLVDRGPKTNAGRRRLKSDSDSLNMELEEVEEIREKSPRKAGSDHQEDIPKGKRRARKRKGVASQERGRRIITRQQRAEMASDYESESCSDSTEDASSEEEAHGDDDEGTSASQSDASTTDSEDVG